MSAARDPEVIRAKFDDLRETCDPRGHDLLDEIERAMLADNAMLALNERVGELQEWLAGGAKGERPGGQVIPFPSNDGHSVKA